MSSVLSVLRYVFFGCCCNDCVIKHVIFTTFRHFRFQCQLFFTSETLENSLRSIGRSLLPSICHETVFDTQNNQPVGTAVGFLVQDLPCAQRGGQSGDGHVRGSPRFTVLVHKTDAMRAGAVPDDLLGPRRICHDVSTVEGVNRNTCVELTSMARKNRVPVIKKYLALEVHYRKAVSLCLPHNGGEILQVGG